MLKNFSFYIIICIGLTSYSFANPRIIKEKVSVEDIHNKSMALCRRFKPKEVAIVSDKDGTLTRVSVPTDVRDGVMSRGHADLVLLKLIRMGCPVVVSSAWDDFLQTTHELRELGLGDVLKLSDEMPRQFIVSGCANAEFENEKTGELLSRLRFTETLGMGDPYYERKARERFREITGCINVTKHGNVISCQEYKSVSHNMRDYPGVVEYEDELYCPSEQFARAKWRALDFIDEGATPKVVCVWEDSAGNLEMFEDRMKLSKWFPGVEEVYLWQLSSPKGEVFDEDIVPSFQNNRFMVATALDETRWEGSVVSSKAIAKQRSKKKKAKPMVRFKEEPK